MVCTPKLKESEFRIFTSLPVIVTSLPLSPLSSESKSFDALFSVTSFPVAVIVVVPRIVKAPD